MSTRTLQGSADLLAERLGGGGESSGQGQACAWLPCLSPSPSGHTPECWGLRLLPREGKKHPRPRRLPARPGTAPHAGAAAAARAPRGTDRRHRRLPPPSRSGAAQTLRGEGAGTPRTEAGPRYLQAGRAAALAQQPAPGVGKRRLPLGSHAGSEAPLVAAPSSASSSWCCCEAMPRLRRPPSSLSWQPGDAPGPGPAVPGRCPGLGCSRPRSPRRGAAGAGEAERGRRGSCGSFSSFRLPPRGESAHGPPCPVRIAPRTRPAAQGESPGQGFFPPLGSSLTCSL